MTKSEGIGHPLKVGAIEDFGPRFVPDVFERENTAWSISGTAIEAATKYCRTLVSSV